MEAFRGAAEQWGADILELDVRLTRDRRLVVFHDAAVDRTTDGRGRVAGMRWAELRELDAGWRFVDPAGDRSFRGKGVRVPLFEEVLEEFPKMRLNVESKCPRAAAPLVEAIRRHGAQRRVLVASIREVSRRDACGYDGPWGASREQILRFWLTHRWCSPKTPWLGRWALPAADALQVPEFSGRLRVLTPAFVRAAHRRNIPVHVWTVNDPPEMRRLLEAGVDGIESDRPDLLAQVLAEVAGRPLPPGLRRENQTG